MHREKKDKHFLKKPFYDGGPEAMKAFINKHLTYPEEALSKGVQGTVVLKITIDYKGRVVDTHVISGVGAGCDEEAKRVAELLQFEVPRPRGVKVTFHKKIHIHFRKKKKQQGRGISYTVTSSDLDKKKKTEDAEKRPGGYQYTIRIN